MSWASRGRTNTRWRKSISPFTPTRRCPRRSRRRRWIPWAGSSTRSVDAPDVIHEAPPPVAGPDKIGVALGAVGAGASFGGAVVVAGLLVFRSWQASGAVLPANFPLLSGPLFAGIVSSVVIAWRESRPVQDVWHRGVVCGL